MGSPQKERAPTDGGLSLEVSLPRVYDEARVEGAACKVERAAHGTDRGDPVLPEGLPDSHMGRQIRQMNGHHKHNDRCMTRTGSARENGFEWHSTTRRSARTRMGA